MTLKTKKIPFVFLLLVSVYSLTTFAETYYVSDELSAPYQSGASNEYRVLGSLKSGDIVDVQSWSADGKYAQFMDKKGKAIWIKTEYLSQQASAKLRIPELEQEVTRLTGELATIEQRWQEQTADIQQKISESDTNHASLSSENDKLKMELSIANKKLGALEVQLDEKRRDIILQWFLYGGGVAGGGLLLGVLLPKLIPRRKDKRWMR